MSFLESKSTNAEIRKYITKLKAQIANQQTKKPNFSSDVKATHRSMTKYRKM